MKAINRYLNFTLIVKCILGGALLAGILFLLFDPAANTHRKYPQRQEVKFWHMWTGEWKKEIDKIVDAFNESQTEYEVTSISITGGASGDAKPLLATAGGDPPDCMAQWNCVIPTWASRKAIRPIEELMSPADKEAFDQCYPVIKKICNFRGKNYGLCIGLNIRALYYRPSYFREAGLDPNKPPKTISELTAMSDKLYKTEKNGKISRIGLYPNLIHEWIPSFGPGWYDDQTGKLTINTPANRRCLDWIQSFPKKYGVNNLVFFTESFQTGTGGQLDWAFLTGGYAMIADGQWRVEQLARYAPQMDYMTAPLPMNDEDGRENAGYCNGNFIVIPSTAKCPKGAWAFMRFWSGLDHPERAAKFFIAGGWMPISPTITQTQDFQAYLTKHPQWKTFVDLLPSPNLQVLPPVTYQNFMRDRIDSLTQVVTNLKMTPEEVLKNFETTLKSEQARLQEGDINEQ